MAYQVLARKWRPKTFQQMVGQEHVIQALVHALDHQQLHHAYLFTGTRGVGKTSLGRILTQCLNCDVGISATPCGRCESCRAIAEGRFVDLIEVDAASRTRVEDTRELLDNVPYRPTQGRFKVYLIDEVHMLSGHSFNALLKTLEEPPEYIKFIFATTDPEKLPVTILSRCLRFHLKALPVEKIQGQLEYVLSQEGISFESSGVRAIARAADGSMRDGLSLLDQAIAHGGGQVVLSSVSAMLGTIDHRFLFRILASVAATDAKALVACTQEIAEQSVDYIHVLDGLLHLLYQLSFYRATGVFSAFEFGAADEEDYRQLADHFTPELLQLFYQITLLGRKDCLIVPDIRLGFEMTLLRLLAFCPTTAQAEQRAPKAQQAPKQAPVSAPISAPAQPTDLDWSELIEQLPIGGLTRALASNCVIKERTAEQITLLLSPSYAALNIPGQSTLLANALSDYWHTPIKVNIVQGEEPLSQPTPAVQTAEKLATKKEAALAMLQQDPHARAIEQLFQAESVESSLKL